MSDVGTRPSETQSTALSTTQLGAAWVRAIVEHDAAALRAMLTESVSFKGLTPRRCFEAETPDEVVAVVLGTWFEESDVIETATSDVGEIADLGRVGYRFEITNPDGPHVVEQQAYLHETDGRIDYLRIVCSGYRPRR